MIYVILMAHTILVAFCFVAERRLLRCKFLGPLSVAVLFSYAPNIVGRCGVITYSTSVTILPDLILLGADTLLVIVGLISYQLFLPKKASPLIELNHHQSVAVEERVAFNKIFWGIAILFFLALLVMIKLVLSYGVGALLDDASGYHNWAVEQGAMNTMVDNSIQIIAGAGPMCLGFVLVIWAWRRLSYFKKIIGVVMVLSICFISLFMSRAILVMATVPALFVVLFSGALILSKAKKYYVFGLIFIIAFSFITIRRASYLGSESGFVLLNYFGITSTALPDSFVQTRLGQVALTVITYASGPYSNFSNIINDHNDLALTYGIMSSRVVNPLVSIISPGLSNMQKTNLATNTDILLVSYQGGGQWSMAYGPTFLDFGFAGPFLYAIMMGLLIPFCTIRAAQHPPARAFLILYIVFFIAFTFFQMPPLAPHHGVFLCLALFALLTFFPREIIINRMVPRTFQKQLKKV